jgi:hypothetical protein
MPYTGGVIAEIVSLPPYEAQVSALMREDERQAMEFFIACAPEAHPVIIGTGGFRKARWALAGKGKRGGVRVVYFFLAAPGQIYMASVYRKSAKATVSAADKKMLAKLSIELKKDVKGGKGGDEGTN